MHQSNSLPPARTALAFGPSRTSAKSTFIPLLSEYHPGPYKSPEQNMWEDGKDRQNYGRKAGCEANVPGKIRGLSSMPKY
jgi:hypothetical protein